MVNPTSLKIFEEGVVVTSQEHVETEVQIVPMLNMVLLRARCTNREGQRKKVGTDCILGRKLTRIKRQMKEAIKKTCTRIQ